MIRILGLFSLLFTATLTYSQCSPCGNLSNVSQTINGNNLELTFTSNAGWQCCYSVSIELICDNENFTGTATHFSNQICLNGGGAPNTPWGFPMAYPTTTINIANLCPGTYKWRAWEEPCNNYTQEFTFIKPGNMLSVNANAVSPIVCEGQATNVSGSASNGCQGPFTFEWTPALGVANTTVANTTITPTSTTLYTLTVSEPGTCGQIISSDDVLITVLPPPTVTVSNDIVACAGDPAVNITFTGANGSTPYTFTYNINGVVQPPIISTGNIATFTIPTIPTGTFTYELTNVEEGSSAECKSDLNETVTVSIHPLPLVSGGPDFEFCESSPTAPTNITLTGSGANTYSWNNGVTNGIPFPPVSGITTYTVTGTDANGCVESDMVTISAYPQPIASAAPSSSTGSTPFTLTFDNQSIDAGICSWDFGDGTGLDQNPAGDASHTYTQSGTYTITLIVENGLCSDTTSFQIVVLGPITITTPNVFSPNGNDINDLYFLSIENGELVEAQILNRWGNLIHTLDLTHPSWNGKTSAGQDCLEGTYFIQYKARDYNNLEYSGHSYFHLVR